MSGIARFFEWVGRWENGLARSHPRLRVTGLHRLVLVFGLLTGSAAIVGYATPGTTDSVTDPGSVAEGLFLLGLLGQVAWGWLQWRHRSTLPPGCGASLAWSLPANFFALGLFMAPAFAFAHANAAAIREKMPLGPSLDAVQRAKPGAELEWWDTSGSLPERLSQRRSERRRKGTMNMAASSAEDSCADIARCLRLGFRFTMHVDGLWSFDLVRNELCDSGTIWPDEREVWTALRRLFTREDLECVCEQWRLFGRERGFRLDEFRGNYYWGPLFPELTEPSTIVHRGPGARRHRGMVLVPGSGERTSITELFRAHVRYLTREMAGDQASAAVKRAGANLRNIARAHRALGESDFLRDAPSTGAVLALTTFLSAVLLLAPYVRWRVVAIHTGLLVTLIALMELMWAEPGGRHPVPYSALAPWSLGAPLMAAAVLRLARVRRVRHEVLVTLAWFFPFVVMLGRARSSPTEYAWWGNSLHLDERFWRATGLVWLIVTLAVYLLVTPLARPLLDRYRSLPEP